MAGWMYEDYSVWGAQYGYIPMRRVKNNSIDALYRRIGRRVIVRRGKYSVCAREGTRAARVVCARTGRALTDGGGQRRRRGCVCTGECARDADGRRVKEEGECGSLLCEQGVAVSRASYHQE